MMTAVEQTDGTPAPLLAERSGEGCESFTTSRSPGQVTGGAHTDSKTGVHGHQRGTLRLSTHGAADLAAGGGGCVAVTRAALVITPTPYTVVEVKVAADAMCKLVEHIVIGLDETAPTSSSPPLPRMH